MSQSVAELQKKCVALELECIDRIYLYCYVPQLTSAPGVAAYFRHYKGHRFASTHDARKPTARFCRNIDRFAKAHGIPVHRFAKGERKDDVMHRFLKRFKHEEGVVFIGIAQEKAWVPRTLRKRTLNGIASSWSKRR